MDFPDRGKPRKKNIWEFEKDLIRTKGGLERALRKSPSGETGKIAIE